MRVLRALAGRPALLPAVVLLVALGPRLAFLGDKGAWLDEATQAEHSARSPFDPSLAVEAAEQQQPPLDYFVQAVALSAFGPDETGLRIHAALAGALAALLFFAFLKRLLGSARSAFLGALVFALHPWLIRYSQEGRPISMAVLFAVAYLHTALGILRALRPALFSFVVLVLVALGFLLSAGFQPIVFLLASVLAMAPLLWDRDRRIAVGQIAACTLVAFLAALPIIALSIETGAAHDYVRYGSLRVMLLAIVLRGAAFSFGDVAYCLETGFFGFAALAAVAGVGGAIGLVRSRPSRRDLLLLAYLLLLSLAFPFAFAFLYRALVTWRLKERYFLVYVPVCLTLLGVAIHHCGDLLTRAWRRSRPLGITLVALVAAAATFSLFSSGQAVLADYARKKSEWNELYRYFVYEGRPGDTAYMVNLVAIDKWAPGFRAQNLYYTPERARPVALQPGDALPIDLEDPDLWSEPKAVYLVTTYGAEKLTPRLFADMYDVTVHSFHEVSFVEIERGARTRERVVGALRRLARKLAPKPDNYVVHALLAEIDIGRKDVKAARADVRMLSALARRAGPTGRGKLRLLVLELEARIEVLEKELALSASAKPKPPLR